jgi:predicted dehydrogenase
MKKVLFIGLGGIGQRHLRNVLRVLGKDTELVALRREMSSSAEINNDLTRSDDVDIVKKYSISVKYDLQSALSALPYVTFICTPSSMHIEYAIAAVRAGSHVFIEKPLSDSLEGVEELEELAIANKKVVYVGFQLRFNPVINKLQELIDKNAIGVVTAVRSEVGEYMPGFHKYENYRDSYASRAELGGGVILTQIHELDYLQAIFGSPGYIYALAGSSPALGLDVEDVVEILMSVEFEGRSVPIALHMDFCQRPTRRSCLVYGEAGMIVGDLVRRTVVLTNKDGERERFSWNDQDRNSQFIDQTSHFFDCLDLSTKPRVPLFEAKKSLRIALAAKASLNSKLPQGV